MFLCLTSGAVTATLAIQAFTLAWMHSVEKIRWEEDWKIEGRQLQIIEARIKGTGAGMEPPPDAVFREGFWHYHPTLPPLSNVNLAHSPYTTGYEICVNGTCQQLAGYLPGIADIGSIELTPCER